MKKHLYTVMMMLFGIVSLYAQQYRITPPQEDEVVVGAIGGVVDVTALGGASYKIPIQIPEGIDGMQPDLSIVYNSQNGNGLLGWGWDLGGLSSITRVGRTQYHDGKAGGVFLDANDRFALDGQRLMVVGNSTYGAGQAEYKTEEDVMSKIVSYTDHGFDGPKYFKVWTADGLVLEYGNDENARVVYDNDESGRKTVVIWLLNRVENREGNYVVYNYEMNEHDYKLTNIQYSGHSGSKTTIYGISFHYYAQRVDRESEAIGNYFLYHPWLLKDISIYHWSQPLSKYEFAYDENSGQLNTPNYYNKLTEIHYENDGTKIHPTTIDWTDYPDVSNSNLPAVEDVFVSNVAYHYEQPTNVQNETKFAGDFNGDGLQDFIVVGPSSSDEDTVASGDTCELRAGVHSAFVFMNMGHTKTDHEGGSVYFDEAGKFTVSYSLRWIYVCDFDGDGIDEVLFVGEDTHFVSTYVHYDIMKLTCQNNNGNAVVNRDSGNYVTYRSFLDNGAVFTTFGGASSIVNNSAYFVTPSHRYSFVVGDFLGKGHNDIIFTFPYQHFRYITYDESTELFTETESNADWNGVAYTTGDFDGDGKTEVWFDSAFDNEEGIMAKVYINSNGQYSWYLVTHIMDSWNLNYTGDFNGDGHTDFLTYRKDTHTWKIMLFMKDWHSYPVYDVTNKIQHYVGETDPGDANFSLGELSDLAFFISVFDADGDGISDVMIRNNEDRNDYQVAILYGPPVGNDFSRIEEYDPNDIGIAAQPTPALCIGNFLAQENMGVLGYEKLFSVPQKSIYYNVRAITDGMGNRVSFDFDYLVHNPKKVFPGHDRNIYTVSGIGNNLGGYYIYHTPLPVKAVSRIETYNTHLTFEAHAVDSCSYHNAMIHKHGKGFLGFEGVTHDNWLVQNEVKGRATNKHQSKTVSTYDHKPMGEHCKVLLINEEVFRYKRRSGNPSLFDEVAESGTYYGYMKFLCNRDNSSPGAKVFIPVPVTIVSDDFDLNSHRTLLRRKITETVYNGQSQGPGTYNNAVRPTETRQGVDAGQLSQVANCEFQVRKSSSYMQDLSNSWILNRPSYVYLEKTRNTEGFDDVKLLTKYVYYTQKPYLPKAIYTYPSGYESSSDKLATIRIYTYQNGKVKTVDVEAINDTLQPRGNSYDYDPHYRFMTKETNPYGHETSYHYDEVYGTLDYTTDCNGYRQVTQNDDHMGITVRTFETDNDADATEINGTEAVTAIRWLQDSGFGQYAQGLADPAYFSWKKSEGSAETVVIYDAVDRELRTVSRGLRESGSNIIYQDTQYDNWGRVYRTSEPYFSDTQSGDIRWTTYMYDDFDRMVRADSPSYLVDNEVVEPYTVTEYDGLKTTVETGAVIGEDEESHTVETMTNIMGWTDYVKEYLDPELLTYNTTNYEYNADGSLVWTKVNNDETSKISIVYDQARNRRELHDPDYGTTITKYNAFGQLQRQQTPKSDVTIYRYDKLGRLVVREETDNNSGNPVTETTTWTYSNTAGKKGLPESIALDQRQEITYTYDPLHYNNVVEVAEDRNGTEYSVSYLYSDSNFPKRVSSVTYPSGYTVEQGYDAVTGGLTAIHHNNHLLWQTLDANALGQITHFQMGNGVHSYYQYDDRHYLEAQQASKNSTVIQDFGYEYDIFGNLAARTEDKFIMPLRESFQYDRLNRLKTVTLGVVESSMDYDAQGRILLKEADGQTVFSNAQYNTLDPLGNLKPHAISSATVTGNPFPGASMDISYTMFDKVKTVTQNNASGTPVSQVRYQYGFDHERISMVKGETYEKHYWGNCELINNSGSQMWNTYVSGPLGVFAAVTGSNNTETTRYIYKDHLGSWTTITDDAGVIQQELSFDAWGNLRSPGTWSGTYNGLLLYDRGFTGHEHLFDLGLINMNGRMYDPVMSSFLSVDNFIQSPGNSQNFNRYAYCMNNPLRYTDPDGEIFIVDSWLSGYLQGYFSTSEDKDRIAREKAQRLAMNDLMIWGGLFQTDSNKDFLGNSWECVSRFTWQLPQTIAGFGLSQISNLVGQIDRIEYYGGATICSGNFFGRFDEAVTLGSYINGYRTMYASPDNYLFQHEYGHYLQSQEMGLAYLNRVGIPSLLSTGNHKYHPIEMDANRRAFLYFNKHVEGFYKTEDDMYRDHGWDFYENPVRNIDEDNKYIDFYDSGSLELLNNLTVHAKWYDYICWRKYKYGPLIIGLYNALLYNYQNY